MIQSDPTRMYLKFICHPDIQTWCGTLMVYESDWFTDDILKHESFCVNGVAKEFWYELYSKGDYSPHYEWLYKLSHNCTSDQKNRCLEPEEHKRTKTDGIQYVHFIEAVMNAGEQVDNCTHPNG
ncbi:hypothetical protein GCK72_022980 [Caenorhabditis remanei]|nr:hypothetical protein GCK72_022980 [Caenorhabditis remanei]KAF1746524.1 hypothetical protein GCK72_022980 [Caenorhabditis remanei]